MVAASTYEAFDYRSRAQRIVFGPSTVSVVADAVRDLNCSRAALLVGPNQTTTTERVLGYLGGLTVAQFDQAAVHTPVTTTERAVTAVNRAKADCLVAVGGGSAIGLGKAIALRLDLPVVAIPTTYSGSEMTSIVGQTDEGRKTTVRDPGALPRTVIYDIELTLSLPARLSAASGMNALAHAVEALWARDANPITTALAEEAIRRLGSALPLVVRDLGDPVARGDCLTGAMLAGMCLAATEMSLHHRLCHVLGGMFDLPHAETHAIVLPHVIAYNTDSAPHAIATIALSLGGDDAADAMSRLGASLGLPQTLGQIGMRSEDIPAAAAAAVPCVNPRAVDIESVERLLVAAC